MAYRNRGYGANRGDADFDEQRNDPYSNRRSTRGYGDDYRGYSRGYNISHTPNYGTEYDEGQTGRDRLTYENYGRGSGANRWGSTETQNWETGGGVNSRSYFGQGPMRSHLRCRDIMTRNVTTCRRDTPITEVARLMRDEDVGAVPVIGDDGKLAGIVTDRDLVVEGLTSDKPDQELRAEDCMSDDLFTANQNDRLVDMIHEMGDHQVRRVPVVDSRDRLVGIIAMADIATQTNKDAELEEALKDISQPSSFIGRLANMFNW
jgi:CBS domain-containing protein